MKGLGAWESRAPRARHPGPSPEALPLPALGVVLKAGWGRWPEPCHRGPTRARVFSVVVCRILLLHNSSPSSSPISPMSSVFSKVGVSPTCSTHVEPDFPEPASSRSGCPHSLLASPPLNHRRRDCVLFTFAFSLWPLSVSPPGTISRLFSPFTQQVHTAQQGLALTGLKLAKMRQLSIACWALTAVSYYLFT